MCITNIRKSARDTKVSTHPDKLLYNFWHPSFRCSVKFDTFLDRGNLGCLAIIRLKLVMGKENPANGRLCKLNGRDDSRIFAYVNSSVQVFFAAIVLASTSITTFQCWHADCNERIASNRFPHDLAMLASSWPELLPIVLRPASSPFPPRSAGCVVRDLLEPLRWLQSDG